VTRTVDFALRFATRRPCDALRSNMAEID
jgi:hypothetical protein